VFAVSWNINGNFPSRFMQLFRVIRLLAGEQPDKSRVIGDSFSGKRHAMRAKNLSLFEIALVLVRVDHVASGIVKANHGIM
jgi:hypothetical protein